MYLRGLSSSVILKFSIQPFSEKGNNGLVKAYILASFTCVFCATGLPLLPPAPGEFLLWAQVSGPTLKFLTFLGRIAVSHNPIVLIIEKITNGAPAIILLIYCTYIILITLGATPSPVLQMGNQRLSRLPKVVYLVISLPTYFCSFSILSVAMKRKSFYCLLHSNLSFKWVLLFFVLFFFFLNLFRRHLEFLKGVSNASCRHLDYSVKQ